MKKVLIFVLAMLLVIGLCSCGGGESTDKKGRSIGVVAKGESHAFWQSVRAGAEAAAKEKGYTVTFRGPASESAKDLPSQQEMVQTALSNNVSGLVIATIGEGFTDMLSQAKERGIPVVQFDSGIWPKDAEALDAQGKNPTVASVATSNTLAAALAAERFFEAVKDDIASSDSYVIGVIQHDQTRTGIDRALGFIDRFTSLADADESTKGRYRIEKEVKPGDADNAYKTALEALYEKGISALFMTNEGVVKQVYDAIGASGGKYDGIKFCGFDAGSKQIEWMKSDSNAELVGAVAQDSYQIGYNAVKQLINAIEGEAVTQTVDIEGIWWDASNVDQMIANNIVYEG
ncbi:MAG: substrate-binding domain-containing protein [Clostridia bacterium]|nr:substrate-binding domain-containing protein [Clostridia bacterium]